MNCKSLRYGAQENIWTSSLRTNRVIYDSLDKYTFMIVGSKRLSCAEYVRETKQAYKNWV